MNKNASEEQKRLLPEHLEQVFKASTNQLSLVESLQLAHLLTHFEDVFARSEFDLGYFSEVQHTIDTGQARPIKLRM